MTVSYFTRLSYCVLCGEKLSRNTNFRCVVPSNKKRVLTSPINFRGMILEVYPEGLDVAIVEPYPAPFCTVVPAMHDLCWNALTDQPSLDLLWHLGLIMTPKFWTEPLQNILKDPFAVPGPVQMPASDRDRNEGKDTLRELLERCGRLPVELIAMIWDGVPPSAVRCLQALESSKSIWPTLSICAESATLSLHGDIRLYSTSVLDGKYICGIRQGDRLYGHKSTSYAELSIPQTFVAIMFVLGNYGLRDISIFRGNELGFTIGTSNAKRLEFVQIAYSREATPVRVDIKWDALKISQASCQSQSRFGFDLLWANPLPSGDLPYLSPEFLSVIPGRFDILNLPKRFFGYVPLRRNDFRLYGLTLFCSMRMITGIGTHFCSSSQSPKTYWYGQQIGCSVHFQLAHWETVDLLSVFYSKLGSISLAPFSGITTSSGKSIMSAPYFSPSSGIIEDIYNVENGELLGLIYEMHAPRCDSFFCSLGAVCRPWESSPELASRSPERHEISYDDYDPRHLFASQALLRDIQVLKACYVKSRCTGMLIIYEDDTRSVLGQWYESTDVQPETKTLSFQPDHVLRFHMSDDSKGPVLLRVESLPSSSPSVLEDIENTLDVVYGDNVIWMFSVRTDKLVRGSDEK